MTLGQFLCWLTSHQCVVFSFFYGPGTHTIVYGGSCLNAFHIGQQSGGLGLVGVWG